MAFVLEHCLSALLGLLGLFSIRIAVTFPYVSLSVLVRARVCGLQVRWQCWA